MRNVAKQQALLSIGVVVFCAWSCQGAGPGSSDVKVTNGEAINASSYPYVVPISILNGQGLCSGTFVSPQVLLTAGHCVVGGGVSFGGTNAAQIITFGTAVAGGDDVTVAKLDLAVVTFSSNVAPAVATLTTRQVKPGDKITIVGFGTNDDVDGQVGGAGTKRLGTNTVEGFIAPGSGGGDNLTGMVYFEGVPRDSTQITAGQSSLGGFGDSGGGVFIDTDKLAMVTSRGAARTDSQTVTTGSFANYAMDIDLMSGPSQKLLACAVAKGIQIPGITADPNPSSCTAAIAAAATSPGSIGATTVSITGTPAVDGSINLQVLLDASSIGIGLFLDSSAQSADNMAVCNGSLSDCLSGKAAAVGATIGVTVTGAAPQFDFFDVTATSGNTLQAFAMSGGKATGYRSFQVVSGTNGLTVQATAP